MPHHVFIIWMNPPLCPEQVLVIVWAGGHYHCYVTRAIPSPALGQTQEEAQPIFNCVFILALFPGPAPVLHTASDQKRSRGEAWEPGFEA